MFDIVVKTNRMWLSVVCTLIDNDTRHHSGQNLLRAHSAAPRESTTFWPLWWRVSLSIRVNTTLNHIRFVKITVIQMAIYRMMFSTFSTIYSVLSPVIEVVLEFPLPWDKSKAKKRRERTGAEAYSRFSPVVWSKLNRNHSMNKVKNLGYNRWLIFKQPRQESDLCSFSFASYLQKCVTQIYRALHGESPCLCQGHKHGGRKVLETSVTKFCYWNEKLLL